MPYKRDRDRADQVLPDVRRVLKEACGWTAEIADEYLDNFEATDVIADGRFHVAVRSRSAKLYLAKYGHEFTLRSRRTSGTETELSKIHRGFGDYLLYGFLDGWTHKYFRIIDLTILRGALDLLDIDAISIEKPNTDGRTFFRAFDVRRFGPNFPIVFKEGY